MKKSISLLALVIATLLMLTSCMPLATIVASTPLPTPQTNISTSGTTDESLTTKVEDITTPTTATTTGTTGIAITQTNAPVAIPDINDPKGKNEPRPGFENVNFGGYTFTFASPINATDTWNDYEVYADENNTGIHASSIRERNQVLKELYNCSIAVVDIDSVTLSDDLATNQNRIDLVLTRYNVGTKADGKYHNFYSLGIDLDKPWWDQNFIKDVTLNGQLYTMLGAFSLTSLDATWVMFFNKTVKANNADLRRMDFYELVLWDVWTLDKFYEIVKLAAVDDGDTNMTLGSADTFGLVSSSLAIRGLYFGAGQSYINKTDSGDDVTSFTTGLTQTASDVTDKIIQIYGDSASAITNYMAVEKQMRANKVLFTPDCLRMASKYLSDESGKDLVEFGVLPFPKYNGEQEEFRHNVDNHFIYLCVPTTCTDLTRITRFLEVYAYHSYYTVYKDYTDRYRYQYTTDLDSPMMVGEFILKTRCFDIAYHFNLAGIDSEYSSCVQKGENLIPTMGTAFSGAMIESANNYLERYYSKDSKSNNTTPVTKN